MERRFYFLGWVASAEADSVLWRVDPALTCRASFRRRCATGQTTVGLAYFKRAINSFSSGGRSAENDSDSFVLG